MTTLDFTGVMVANVTPFTEDDRINYDALQSFARWLASVPGGTGLVCNGHAGEGASLDDEERAECCSMPSPGRIRETSATPITRRCGRTLRTTSTSLTHYCLARRSAVSAAPEGRDMWFDPYRPWETGVNHHGR
jgi:hypothetical protein